MMQAKRKQVTVSSHKRRVNGRVVSVAQHRRGSAIGNTIRNIEAAINTSARDVGRGARFAHAHSPIAVVCGAGVAVGGIVLVSPVLAMAGGICAIGYGIRTAVQRHNFRASQTDGLSDEAARVRRANAASTPMTANDKKAVEVSIASPPHDYNFREQRALEVCFQIRRFHGERVKVSATLDGEPVSIRQLVNAHSDTEAHTREVIVEANDLPVGTHTIKVTATTPTGKPGSASCHWQVLPAKCPATAPGYEGSSTQARARQIVADAIVTKHPMGKPYVVIKSLFYAPSKKFLLTFSVHGEVDEIACEIDGRNVSCGNRQVVFGGMSAGWHQARLTVKGPGGTGFAEKQWLVPAGHPAAIPMPATATPTPAIVTPAPAVIPVPAPIEKPVSPAPFSG